MSAAKSPVTPSAPPPTVWTARRKAMGNLVPALVWLSLATAGITVMVITGNLLGWGLFLLVSASVLGWLALDAFGLFENYEMRVQLTQLIQSRNGVSLDGCAFVGFSTPRYHGLLDAHEDVGFLRVLPDRIQFISETRTVELRREDIRQVRFRPNVHSMVGLGRWVSLDGESNGVPVRMLIEPRERTNMMGNLRFSNILRAQLEAYAKRSPEIPTIVRHDRDT